MERIVVNKMDEFSIAALAQIIKAQPVSPEFTIRDTCGRATQYLWQGYTTCKFTGVSTDSRTVQAGDCFFAISGENFDGHDYICDAFAKGAVCAVVSKSCVPTSPKRKRRDKSPPLRSGLGMLLKVNNTVKALGDLAREYRRQCGFKVIAITGSVGKTMTRQIVYHVLSRHYQVFQSPKNYNNQIGLPLTLLGANSEHEIVIAELGTNHPGEIAYLTRIAQPNVAVVTNVQQAHLEGFGDLQAIAKEKFSIAEGLREDGILIINADIVPRFTGHVPRVVTFGKSEGCDYQAGNISYDGLNSSFTIAGKEVYLPIPGAGNVENALAGWAVCSRFDITIDDFIQAVKTLKTVPMRVEMLQIGTLKVLNDCYNANPASMKNALDILRQGEALDRIKPAFGGLDTDKKHRLVFICGDMAELGPKSKSLHAELGVSIAQVQVGLLITVGKFAEVTAEAAKKTAECDLKIKCFEDTLSACNNLQGLIKDEDIILVKGSRSAELEKVVDKLKELFS